jgi:hypothetical protein
MTQAISRRPNLPARDSSPHHPHLHARDWAYLGVGLAFGGLALAQRSWLSLLGAGAAAYAAYLDHKADALKAETWPDVVKAEITRRVQMNATCMDVFDLINVISNWSLFFPSIQKLEVINDDHAVCSGRWSYFKATVDVIITERNPGRSIKFSVLRGDLQFAECVLSVYEGTRGTVVMLSCEYPSSFHQLDQLVLKPRITYEMDTCIQRIKQLAEAGEIARTR